MDNLPKLPHAVAHILLCDDREDDHSEDVFTSDQMRAYALAAIEAEREACAKLCEDHQKMREATGHPREASTARKLAGMIRARGKS